MKILVMSDSHGAKNSVVKAVRKESPDYVLHLGDGEHDLTAVAGMFPNIQLRSVRGNCEIFSPSAETEGFTLEGKSFLMTHGHLFYVKSTLDNLVKYAKKQQVDIVLFGHTHVAFNEIIDGMLFVNPGSIGYSSPASYAVIEIINGDVTCAHRGVL